mgnify:CR=1 FL=1
MSGSQDRDVAILGVGMHPWGKWGRNFVEYGVIAARAALADAGVDYREVQFVSGADTMRNGYPGYVSGATFAQALGWSGAQVASCYAACASGVTALATARKTPRPSNIPSSTNNRRKTSSFSNSPCSPAEQTPSVRHRPSHSRQNPRRRKLPPAIWSASGMRRVRGMQNSRWS